MAQKNKGWLGRIIMSLIPDILAVTGAGFIVRGCCLIYEPAGWIAGGAALVSAAVIWSKGGGSA